MCRYTFWANSREGLKEDVTIIADTWNGAIEAVDKHIQRQVMHITDIPNKSVVQVHITCDVCYAEFKAFVHLDTAGHKEKSTEQLLTAALMKNTKYLAFKKKHSKHTYENGWLRAFNYVERDPDIL